MLKNWPLLVLCLCMNVRAQFTEEVQQIQQRYDTLWNAAEETIVFTGSSSIRLWKDLEARFPNKQIINTGFGGSQASDLLKHLNELVIAYRPKKVFIYEGDNDIFSKKRPKQIIPVFETIVQRIRDFGPETDIFLISAKPSISRWRLRGRYKRLNKKLQLWAHTHEKLHYIDVWNVMLEDKKLNQDLFIEDGLHMNALGYDIWEKAIQPFME